jgi:hypothetical protein
MLEPHPENFEKTAERSLSGCPKNGSWRSDSLAETETRPSPNPGCENLLDRRRRKIIATWDPGGFAESLLIGMPVCR